MTDAPIFILAGEPSGDQLAAHMMKALTARFGPIDWIGVGGSAMRRQGLTTLIDMDALTIFGFGRALSSYLRLSRLMDRLVNDVMAMRPRLVLTVDVKGFSLRFAGRLRRAHAASRVVCTDRSYGCANCMGMGGVARRKICCRYGWNIVPFPF